MRIILVAAFLMLSQVMGELLHLPTRLVYPEYLARERLKFITRVLD